MTTNTAEANKTEEHPGPPWIILDTETNKLPDYKLPADHPDQPRLAAMTLIFCDPQLVAQSTITHLIQPDGWEMEAEAGIVNGLTTERLKAEGVPVDLALSLYTKAVDDGRAVGAFGAQFDCKIMRGELRRKDIDDRFAKTLNYCAMRNSMGIVKKQNGKGGWPSLADACAHFKINQTGHHTSLGDAMAALEVMRWLNKIKGPLVPTVHFAKEKPERKAGSGPLSDKDVKLQDGDSF